MKILLSVVYIFFFSANSVYAQVNLNPPYGSVDYKPYSVFSADKSYVINKKNDVIVVFHGFKSAIPNGTFKIIRKSFLRSHLVIGINYDPLNVGGTLEFLDNVHEEWLTGRNVTVLGTSAGAYWANLFGHRIGAQKIILLNPVTDPVRQLGKYIGLESKNLRRDQSFVVTVEQLAAYKTIGKVNTKGIPRLVILSADDKLLDYRDALDMYAGASKTTIILYSGGGHTINLRKHRARAAIVDFISNN